MNKTGRRPWLGGIVAIAIATTIGTVAMAQVDYVAKRQGDMKSMGAAMKAIKAVVDAEGPAADAVAPATKITEVAAILPDDFPVGSDQGDTEAKPEIWQDFEGFKGKAGSLGMQAKMLVSAAEAGDIATIRAQFEKVGAACGACHKEYRAKK